MTILARTVVVLCLLASPVGSELARADCPNCGLARALAGRESCWTCGFSQWNLPWRESSFLPLHGSPESLPPWPVGQCDGGDCESTGWMGMWSGGCFDTEPPRWTVKADALLLQRSTAQSQDLLFVPAMAAPDVVALSMADLGFGLQAGPRVGLTRHFTPDYGLEIGYFGLWSDAASAVRNGNPNILFPGGGAFFFSTQFAVDYESDLHSAEVSLRHQCFSRLNLLVGLRWVELRESFHVGGPNPLAPDPALRYDTDVANSLYGFQIGADTILLDYCGRWRMDGFLKAGVFANSSHQETSAVDAVGGPAVEADDRKDQTAFVGETGLTAIYHLTDHLDARAGYQVMWITGVALAPDQIPNTNVTPPGPGAAVLDANGGVFYHGFHVGFEASW